MERGGFIREGKVGISEKGVFGGWQMSNSVLVKNHLEVVAKALKKIAGIDTNGLSRVLGDIDTTDMNTISYGFSMNFKMSTPPDNTYPLMPLDLKLAMDVNENLQNDETIYGKYSIQITANASKGGKNFLCSWHFDLDTQDENRYLHPRYHLTFGGKTMRDEIKKDGDTFGRLLLMATPRIPAAPMDGILAIDFVLNHFYKQEIISDLLNNSRYREAVKASQQRIWAPYYKSIHDALSNRGNAAKGKQNIPNIV